MLPKAIKIILPILIIAGLGLLAAQRYRRADTSGWLSYTDQTTSISLLYPEKLSTKYISAVDWPPQIQILNGSYSCTEGGAEADRAGETREKTINGEKYCVTRESEGAAGSIYTMYAYAFPWSGKTAILTFSTRSPQCPNYPEPQKSECESERASFDIDSEAASIAKTLK